MVAATSKPDVQEPEFVPPAVELDPMEDVQLSQGVTAPVEVQSVNVSSLISIEKPHLAEPFYQFSNCNRPGSFLRLSSHAYNHLLQGKDVSFYSPKSLSFLRVRVSSRSSNNASNTSVFVGERMDADYHHICDDSGPPEDPVRDEAPLSESDKVSAKAWCVPLEESIFRFSSKRRARRHIKHFRHHRRLPTKEARQSRSRRIFPFLVSQSHFCRYHHISGRKRKFFPDSREVTIHPPWKRSCTLVSLFSPSGFRLFANNLGADIIEPVLAHVGSLDKDFVV